MTLVIYRSDSSIEHIQCDLNKENAIALFYYRQSKYTETLYYSVMEINVTPREFKQFYYIKYPEGITLKSKINITIDKVGIIADGLDTSTISKCPEGILVLINDEQIGIVGVDGLIEVSSLVPRELVIMLSGLTYLTERVVINAT